MYELEKCLAMIVDACGEASDKGGWWHDPETGEFVQRNKGELIALMHSELSEALESIRKGTQDDKLPLYPGEVVELIDCIIRIADYLYHYSSGNVAGMALEDKLAYNAKREDHKPENRRKEGGKKF